MVACYFLDYPYSFLKQRNIMSTFQSKGILLVAREDMTIFVSVTTVSSFAFLNNLG